MAIVLIATPAPSVAAVPAVLVADIEQVLACRPPGETTVPAGEATTANANATSADKPARIVDMAEISAYWPGEPHKEAVGLEAAVLVDDLGNPRFSHVTGVLFGGKAALTAYQAVKVGTRMSAFSARRVADRPVAAWKNFRVTLYESHAIGPTELKVSEKARAALVDARAGDEEMQKMIAYEEALIPGGLQLAPSEAVHFLAIAAASRMQFAVLRLAGKLTYADCVVPQSVEQFVREQAMQGNSEVELLLATRQLRRGDADATTPLKAFLAGAAHAEDDFARLWAAGILATSPVAQVRDPALALQTAQELEDKNDPDVLELLAAAQAANGNYAAAVATQDTAIDRAHHYHWNVAHMKARLARYQQGLPWQDYLCDCGDALVPSVGL